MSDVLILANLINSKLATDADLDVATFVDVNKDGSFAVESRTYQNLWDNGQRIAAALQAEGMQLGDRFGLLMQNHAEFVDAMVGASIDGSCFVPIDPRTKGDKLKYMLSFTECSGVIVADYSLPQLNEILDQLPDLKWVWVLDTGLNVERPQGSVQVREFADILASDVVEAEVRSTDPNAPMQMLFTSGTTGDPKAILSPHARFGSIAQIGHVIGLQEGDRPYTGLSLTHANAQLLTLGCSLGMGLRCVISRKFTKSRLWDITREFGCTSFNLLGGMTTAVFADPRKDNDADNPVRYVLSAGMPKAIWEDFAKRFNVEIFEFYGAAEGGLSFNVPGAGSPIGSIGKAPPSMIATIRDEDDNECPRGVAGEICFQNADGSTPAVAYYKNEAATEKKIKGGWLRMGDIGHMDEDGNMFFHFRDGGGIRRNGDFINPAFIEKAVAENDTVSDVFVYGVPGEGMAPGEKNVVAAIVADTGSNFTPEAIFADCQAKLEGSMQPDFIHLVDEIPKTASEKPQERFLLEAFDVNADNVFANA